MQYATFLMKPASSSCNMQCQYCFYDDVSEHREINNHGIMKDEVMEKMIINIFRDRDLRYVHFAFQGGEPTLAGVDFFYKFIHLVEKNCCLATVTYSLQSNGLLLNQQWLELFQKHHFLIGISLDGYQENHDYLRLTKQHQGTFQSVMNNIKTLQDNHIEYNILTVLTRQLASHPQRIYEFYKACHFQYVQFIPCLSNLDQKEDCFSLKPESFYSFYKELYYLWSTDVKHGEYMHISLFDNLFQILSGQYPSQCGFVGKCQIQNVIESDGSIYPCDFYVLDDYCLGNIQNQSLEKMHQSQKAKDFLDNPSLPRICEQCLYKKICYGQCKRQRQTFMNDEYCAYQALLHDILEDFTKLCQYM